MAEPLLIVGASVRAAAYSALRAGFRPIAFDLFGDRDLRAVAENTVIPGGQYPSAIPEMLKDAPAGPVMYTGALENRPDVIERIGRDRSIFGCDAEAVRRVRDPLALAAALQEAGLAHPRVSTEQFDGCLVKPLRSAGGRGIVRAKRKRVGVYFQEFVEGDSCAGIFVSSAQRCDLLGVTRQLVGEPWLHAPRFGYCGSVGPLELSPGECQAWQALGECVSRFGRLRGVLGIDAIVRDGVPWPVEVNPRYTASMEVVELGTGRLSLAPSPPAPLPLRGEGRKTAKGVYYAPRTVMIPERGPWDDDARETMNLATAPRFADIPDAGQVIAKGRPVVSLFARNANELRVMAQSLDVLFESEGR